MSVIMVVGLVAMIAPELTTIRIHIALVVAVVVAVVVAIVSSNGSN